MAAKKTKPYWEMSLEELRDATREYDGPIPESKLRPLSKAERDRFERARAGGSRSIFLKRTVKIKKVKVELEDDLLQRSAAYASKHKMSLSDVINKSLRSALSFAE